MTSILAEQGFWRPSRHHLRGDVATRARQQRHQSRPGFSRRSRPGGYPPRGGRRGHGRLQPVSVDDGHPRIAPGDRGPLRALAWPRARSDDRSDGDVGRHRGADKRHPRRGRTRRRSGGFPAGLRFLSADHPPGRRHSAPGAAGAAALAADRRVAARRLQPQDQGGAVQQSAQSGRGGLSARGPRIAGAVLPGVRHHRDLRRGLGARDLRRPRAYSADHDSGHARSHHQGRLRRQDFLADRLEDRLCLRRAAAVAGRRQGAPVSHLHHRAQSAGRGRLRPRQAGGIFSRHAQGSGAEPRPADQGTGEHRLPGAEVARHLFPHRRSCRRSGSTRPTRRSASAS